MSHDYSNEPFTNPAKRERTDISTFKMKKDFVLLPKTCHAETEFFKKPIPQWIGEMDLSSHPDSEFTYHTDE